MEPFLACDVTELFKSIILDVRVLGRDYKCYHTLADCLHRGFQVSTCFYRADFAARRRLTGMRQVGIDPALEGAKMHAANANANF